MVDDEEDISEYLRQTSKPDFGRLYFDGKPEQKLAMRDVCNKILHASELKWNVATEGQPVLICISRESEKWTRAEIDLVSLAAFCGGIMS
jgi:hypothetical protein